MPMFRGAAIWGLGFRPMFFLGLMASGILMAVWLWFLVRGNLSLSYFAPSLWHAHEMLYGVVAAVVMGFILTASQNWANLPGVKGWRLILLAILWIAARLLMAVPSLAPHIFIAAVDLIFLPLGGAFLVSYLCRQGQRHNVILLVLIMLMATGNLLMHLGALGVVPGYDRHGLYLGLHVVLLMIIIIGGRVIPFFSERVIPDYNKRLIKRADMAAILSAGAFTASSFIAPVSLATGMLALLAAGINLWRWCVWVDRRIWRIPMLWVLYVGYLWIVIGFTLTALANASLFATTSATHAFTVGAIATMMIGMISRVSLGHTGRPIVAARLTTSSYILITLAALTRVFGPTLAPSHTLGLFVWSGSLWIAAFLSLFIKYAPILAAPRVDGRPG